MALTVTPSRRRLTMAALLALAMAGAVIRTFAPEPSTLRDIGTLLLVLWLPAIGNLIAYLARKIPRRAPPVTDFPQDSPFAPQLQVRLLPAGVPAETLATLPAAGHRCTLMAGRSGFTARLAQPLAVLLAAQGPQLVEVEFLHPGVALSRLVPGTRFHLLVGHQGVAQGEVVRRLG